MEIKNRDVLIMREALNQVTLKSIGGFKFKYGISKNKKIIDKEAELLDEVRKFTPEFEEFNTKREDVAKKYAEKNEDGEPKIKNNQYIFPPGVQAELEKEIEPLREEYKEALGAREKQLKEFSELLEEKAEINFHKIKAEFVPDEIGGVEVSALLPIWDDEPKLKSV